MIGIKYILKSGQQHQVEAFEGMSAMEAARDGAVSEIGGDCGGEASCGTCHVVVDSRWVDIVGAANEGPERSLLEEGGSLQVGSRLACQIKLTPRLDGLILRLA